MNAPNIPSCMACPHCKYFEDFSVGYEEWECLKKDSFANTNDIPDNLTIEEETAYCAARCKYYV